MQYIILDEVDSMYGRYPEPAGESSIVSDHEGSFLEGSVVSLSNSVMFGGVRRSSFMNNARLSTYISKLPPHVFPAVVASDPFDVGALLLC